MNRFKYLYGQPSPQHHLAAVLLQAKKNLNPNVYTTFITLTAYSIESELTLTLILTLIQTLTLGDCEGAYSQASLRSPPQKCWTQGHPSHNTPNPYP